MVLNQCSSVVNTDSNVFEVVVFFIRLFAVMCKCLLLSGAEGGVSSFSHLMMFHRFEFVGRNDTMIDRNRIREIKKVFITVMTMGVIVLFAIGCGVLFTF